MDHGADQLEDTLRCNDMVAQDPGTRVRLPFFWLQDEHAARSSPRREEGPPAPHLYLEQGPRRR